MVQVIWASKGRSKEHLSHVQVQAGDTTIVSCMPSSKSQSRMGRRSSRSHLLDRPWRSLDSRESTIYKGCASTNQPKGFRVIIWYHFTTLLTTATLLSSTTTNTACHYLLYSSSIFQPGKTQRERTHL